MGVFSAVAWHWPLGPPALLGWDRTPGPGSGPGRGEARRGDLPVSSVPANTSGAGRPMGASGRGRGLVPATRGVLSRARGGTDLKMPARCRGPRPWRMALAAASARARRCSQGKRGLVGGGGGGEGSWVRAHAPDPGEARSPPLGSSRTALVGGMAFPVPGGQSLKSGAGRVRVLGQKGGGVI